MTKQLDSRLRGNDNKRSNKMVGKAEKISFTIDKSQGGQRLDIYLAQSEAALSRSQVKYAIEEGDVLVNGKTPIPI